MSEAIARSLTEFARRMEFEASEIAVAPESFTDFIRRVNPRYTWDHLHGVMVDALQRVADGELDRVIINMPAQHGKSETVSRLWPAYLLSRYPDRWVGLTSYAAGLAYILSRNARDYYGRAGGQFKPSARGVMHWETAGGGGMFSAGVGGGITGKGFDYGIIDDPIKDHVEATSPLIHEKHQNWYETTFYSRQRPGSRAAIVLAMTRWDEDDLCGYLLRKPGGKEQWYLINLPAICDPELPPITGSLVGIEPDWRPAGQPLWPEKFSVRFMEKAKSEVSVSTWLANYQQRPQSATLGGRVVHAFSQKNLDELPAPLPDETLYVGFDFNVDPMSLAIAVDRGVQLHFVDEIELSNSNTRAACLALRERYPRHRVAACPDPYTLGRSTIGRIGETDHAILGEFGFEVLLPSDRPSHSDRAAEVNRLFGEPGGIPGVGYVDPRCSSIVRSLLRLSWVPGTREIDKTRGHDHMFDALSFVVHSRRPIRHSTVTSEPLRM